MWGAMAKPGRTGQNAIVTNMKKKKREWTVVIDIFSIFSLLVFVKFDYVDFPYFKK